MALSFFIDLNWQLVISKPSHFTDNMYKYSDWLALNFDDKRNKVLILNVLMIASIINRLEPD